MREGHGVHVVPKIENGGKWSVEHEGKSKKNFRTQMEAIEFGTSLAKQQKTELYIHGKDGKIRERNSYGHDPYPPIG